MWIVKIALNRPYTFIVLGLLILILSAVAILQTPTDIFPNIDIQSKGLSPQDVVNTLSAQNVIAPSGTAKIGQFEYDMATNSAPRTVEELNGLPIKVVGNSTIYLRDVSHVANAWPPQTNIVRQDGRRGVLLTVIKNGAASTINVVQGIRDLLPRVQQTLPPQLDIRPLGDQSVFVRAAISGVVREAVTAACLTGLMILVFIGSWRSTIVIAISIPLAILTSVIVLGFLHETINLMTLGVWRSWWEFSSTTQQWRSRTTIAF
jgi:multidrug efflux pump subunit AcrB